MPASLIEGNSLLAVDIGTVTTRAAYFDVVEGRYGTSLPGSRPAVRPLHGLTSLLAFARRSSTCNRCSASLSWTKTSG
jgi:hypothetical protein